MHRAPSSVGQSDDRRPRPARCERRPRRPGVRLEKIRLPLQFVGGAPPIIPIQQRHVSPTGNSQAARDHLVRPEVAIRKQHADLVRIPASEIQDDVASAIRRRVLAHDDLHGERCRLPENTLERRFDVTPVVERDHQRRYKRQPYRLLRGVEWLPFSSMIACTNPSQNETQEARQSLIQRALLAKGRRMAFIMLGKSASHTRRDTVSDLGVRPVLAALRFPWPVPFPPRPPCPVAWVCSAASLVLMGRV